MRSVSSIYVEQEVVLITNLIQASATTHESILGLPKLFAFLVSHFECAHHSQGIPKAQPLYRTRLHFQAGENEVRNRPELHQEDQELRLHAKEGLT